MELSSEVSSITCAESGAWNAGGAFPLKQSPECPLEGPCLCTGQNCLRGC